MIRAEKYHLPPWHYWAPHLIHPITKLFEHPYCEQKKFPKHIAYKNKWLLNPIACM
jgi:hypothetical protein